MRTLLALIGLLALSLGNAATTITYQGQLQDGSGPFTGTPEMEFRLYESLAGITQVGSTVVHGAVPVTDGLFRVELDFGPVFDGTNLFLEVTVEGQPLSPREAITAAPMAHFAMNPSGPFELIGDDAVYLQGNVGIGTSSPRSALHVVGSATFGDSGNGATGIHSFVGGGAGNFAGGDYSFAGGRRARAIHHNTFVWSDRAAGTSIFGSTNVQQFLIQARNGVGINTNNPVNSLSVAGGADFSESVGVGTDAPVRDLHIKQKSTSNSEIGLQIERSGTSDNNWAFYVAVSDNLGFRYNDNLVARIDTSGEFATLSDANHKTDIEPLAGALERLVQLEPASYRMIMGSADDPVSLGLIAQQVSQILPGAVSKEEDTLGVYYNQITTLNTAALIELNTRSLAATQRLNAELNASANRLSKLDAKNSELGERVAALEVENIELRQLAEQNAELEARLAALESRLAKDRQLAGQLQ